MIQPPPTSTLFPYTTLFRSYYVKSLMGGARLSDNEERLISHQFHQVELDVGEWVRLAASVLSSRVQNPVVVDRKSSRLNSSHTVISYAVFCLKQKRYCK